MADIYELGLFIKDLGSLDMDTFSGRLKFQKTVQLMQAFGFDLRYDYNWYVRGPYCPQLAEDGFILKDVMHTIPNIPVEMADNRVQKDYDNFKAFMKDKMDDPDKLEIAASITFLCDRGLSKTRVLQLTEGKLDRFTMEECKSVWNELEKCGVVSG